MSFHRKVVLAATISMGLALSNAAYGTSYTLTDIQADYATYGDPRSAGRITGNSIKIKKKLFTW